LKAVVTIKIVLVFLIVIYCLSIFNNRSTYLNKIPKNGGKHMPKEFLKEYIGKKVSITIFNDAFAVSGTLISSDGNWIKVENKKNIQIINADHIQQIVVIK
jgi:small nuclear ribonucleoprotein (snRNP)-like protein